MRDEDLIADKYYKYISPLTSYPFLFKFKCIEDGMICCYYSIYTIEFSPNTFLTRYEKGLNISEINFKEVLPFLPSEHPDKINYLRKQRINNLLKL